MSPARKAQASLLAADVESVVDELIRADAIIAAMHNVMTGEQKALVCAVLEADDEAGMVRANERMAVIKKAVGK